MRSVTPPFNPFYEPVLTCDTLNVTDGTRDIDWSDFRDVLVRGSDESRLVSRAD